MINIVKIKKNIQYYKSPFPHWVIDNFFDIKIAQSLEKSFTAIKQEDWHHYKNLLELKSTCNSWNFFDENFYTIFTSLCSNDILSFFREISCYPNLEPDYGLHGGGLHVHGPGGKLNQHLDYSIHPKLGISRRLNIIVYLTEFWQKSWGGDLGLWSHDSKNKSPDKLIKSIEPFFNRAIIFDTSKNSWHGLSSSVKCPEDKQRKSIAMYYLDPNIDGLSQRSRALFAPTETQKDNKEILNLIEKRSSELNHKSSYRTD